MKKFYHLPAKIESLSNWQFAAVIGLIGFMVYMRGLNTPFMGDDTLQIVNNPVVHSIGNIKLLFEGGTFYNGQGLTPLSGVYYRPLMMSVFALLYTLFGAHSFYFHVVQLLLCIGSSIVLFLFFRFTFKPIAALALALVFLIHPINSQVVYSIPNMQDALFFFFGILGLYLLFRYTSRKSLLYVASCFFLSLLGKETALLFMAMALLYLFWFNRKRIWYFCAVMLVPLALWLFLKIHAVGLSHNPGNAPIDSLSLGGRLLTAPSIMSFYLFKFIFPWKLASAYYWVYPHFSVSHVLVPLAIDIITVAFIIYLSFLIRNKTTRARYMMYCFFMCWFGLGLLAHLQIVPLDFTASEPWFYFSMVGLLGMIGLVPTTLVLPSLKFRQYPIAFVAVLIILLLLGARTIVRASDWSSQYNLARHDITASKEDYIADNDIAEYYYSQNKYVAAQGYARRSVAIFPYVTNYNTLGESLFLAGNYDGAYVAFTKGTTYKPYSPLYDNLAVLTLVHGTASTNRQFFTQSLVNFPTNSTLWTYLGLLDQRQNDNVDARAAIMQAANDGQVPQFIYDGIMSNTPFVITLPNLKTVAIP